MTEKKNSVWLSIALTLSPVPDARTMYSIHQSVVSSHLNSSQHQMNTLKHDLDRMTELLPHTRQKTDLHGDKVGVVSIDDVVPWKLVSHEGYLSDEEFTPTREVPGVWRNELESMREKAVQYISRMEDTSVVYKKVINAYWRVDPLSGINYIIDFETSRPDEGKPQTNHHWIEFTRSLNAPEISHTLAPVSTPVTIAVCFTSELVHKLQQFLSRLETVLDRGQMLHLVAVQMRSVAEKQKPRRSQSSTVDAKSLLSLYRSKYTSSSFSLLDSAALLSRSHAISLVLHESRPSEILFIADLDLQLDEAFLEGCRNLPVHGQQVYFPIFFSLRDPAFLASLNHSLIEGSVSHHTGHWVVNSFSVACLYASDLLSLGSDPALKGITNEVDMTEVYSALLERGYEVLRAPDRHLKRLFTADRQCDLDLVGLTVGESCEARTDVDQPHYLRTQLSALLFDHEGDHSANKY